MSNKLSLLVNFVGVDKLSGSLRNITQLGRRGARSLGELRGEGRRLESQLRDVRRELAGASGNVTGLIDRERELERAIDRTNRELAERKRLNAIEGDRRAMRARGDNLMASGREDIAQGAALAAPLVLAAKSAAEFSSVMVDIQQKMELTNAETESLNRRTLVLAQNVKQMPEDMAAGLDMLGGLGGLSLPQIEAAMGPAGRLATAYKVELPDAAAAAHASIKNLQIPASQTAQIFDAMAKAGKEGGFEISAMARHFPALTAQMRALGDTGLPAVADLSAALQVVRATSGNADEAGNNVKNLLAKINAPGTIRAFEKNFGVNLPAAMKKFEDQGYSSLEAIAMVTQEATGGDMKKLGFAFEDMQAQSAIRSLILNLEKYRDIRAKAMNSSGTVDADFALRVANDATVNWRAFMASASALANTLGATFLPVATEAMKMIGGLANNVAEWALANPEAAATITKLVAGLAAFKIGLGATKFLLGGFLKPLANLIAFSSKINLLARTFGVLRTAALFLGSGLMKAGAMMLANPVILIIVAIIAAVGLAAYLIYTHWDTIKEAFWTAVAAVQQAMNTVWNFLKSAFQAWVGLHQNAIQIGKDIIGGLVNGILSAPGRVREALKSVVMAGVNGVKDFLGIKSPSRVFMAIGRHTGEGMALGIEDKGQRVAGAAGGLARSAIGAASIAPPAMPRPLGRRADAGANGGAPAGGNRYEIHIHQQPGEDAEALARRVADMIERKRTSAARSSYQDGI